MHLMNQKLLRIVNFICRFFKHVKTATPHLMISSAKNCKKNIVNFPLGLLTMLTSFKEF